MRKIDCCVIVILLVRAAPLAAAERFFDSGGVYARLKNIKMEGFPHPPSS